MVQTYDTAEIGERGKAIYNQRIRPLVEDGHRGKYVTINVDTGDWEMGDDVLALSERLHAQQPGAPLFTVRVGFATASRMGFGGARRRER